MTQTKRQTMPALSVSTLWNLLVALLAMGSAGAFSSGSRSIYRLPTRSFSRTGRAAHTASRSDETNLDRPWFRASKWPKQKPPPLTNEEKDASDAQAVDQYLEFLDRRYRQIHKEEGTKAEKNTFSAWKWLKHEQPVIDSVTYQKEQEDALYVLGVAGLASKRLLQKHQIVPAASQATVPSSTTAPAIDVPSQPQPPALVKEAARRLVLLAVMRHRLIRYQSRKLQQVGNYLAKGPFRLVRQAWAWGGGRRNVIVTAAIATTVAMLLIKSLLEFLVRDGLNAGV